MTLASTSHVTNSNSQKANCLIREELGQYNMDTFLKKI